MLSSYRERRRSRLTCAGTFVFAIVVVALVGVGMLSFTMIQQHDAKSNPDQLNRRNGNTLVASDIYGTGVRVGVYSQVIGMLMSAASSQIGGIRLAVSGTMIGLLASWTVLAARREFSPCEAAVILALNSALSLVGSTTASVPVVEDGIGLFSLILANVWGIMVSFWFWSDLIFRLPTLETANDVWLFARVNMLGGYRIFVLIMLCIALLAMIARIGNDLAAVREARKEHEEYKLQHGEAAAKTRVEDFVEKAKWATATTAASQGFVVIFVIATVEMTIKYNDLEPEKNLSLPGQTIPFSIGIVVLIDGLFVVCGKGYKWMRR